MISVIIPIYNTEKYLSKCLNSLVRQTFVDVEFILVDDGSTDNSGVIANQYKDSRIRVFHTENHGLSAARNFGIEKARGEWIMFVDSDDWVEPGFCEIPYQTAVRYNADIIIFHSKHVKYEKVTREISSVPSGIIDWKKAVKCGGIAVWNKLYKRELFDGVHFPEGCVFEDLAVTHKLLMRAKRIIVIPDSLYFYVYRKGSLTRCFSVKNKKDAFVLALERAEELNSLGCAKDVYELELISHAITFVFFADMSENLLYRKAEGIVDSIKGIPSYLPWKKKMLLMIWKTNKPIFHLIRKLLHRTNIFLP